MLDFLLTQHVNLILRKHLNIYLIHFINPKNFYNFLSYYYIFQKYNILFQLSIFFLYPKSNQQRIKINFFNFLIIRHYFIYQILKNLNIL